MRPSNGRIASHMTDISLVNEINLVESLSKVFAVALGILYLLGFLVVASCLSQFGVSSFSVLHLQYLLAGVWLLGPSVLHTTLVHASRRFDRRVDPQGAGKFELRRSIAASVLTSIPTCIFLVLLYAIPNVIQTMTWGVGIRFLLFDLMMTHFAIMFWRS
jgi:hypothetical protein